MTISREVLGRYLKPGMVFIETGTRWGDTCIKADELGSYVNWTCETDKVMQGLAIAHLKDAIPGAFFQVYGCESIEFLQTIAESEKVDNCVVFLDAHISNYSPVLQELEAISEWPHKPKAIIIDDMTLMESWGIEIEDIYNHLQAIGDYTMIYEDGRREKDILVAVYE